MSSHNAAPDDSVDRPRGRMPRAVTWRSVLIGTLLAPLNCYWVVMMGEVRYSGHPTTVSLFFNAIFTILVIRLINAAVRWRFPRVALSQGEQIVVYTILSIASALAGHDGIQMLAPIVAAPHWYATPENKWDDLICPHIPSHWVVSDRAALEGVFKGGTTPYTIAHVGPWIGPVVNWSIYMVLLLWVMLCINVLIRRQWTEHEKLSYPLIAVPIEITEPKATLLRDRLLWLGFAIAAGIDILNGLHVQYPVVPQLHVRILNIAPYVKTKPWSAIGWTPISFYPFAIGLGYLLPQDQLFSCWFFFLYWKAVRIGSSIVGYEPQVWSASAPPYINEQAFGGYLGLFAFSLWAMRGYVKQVWACIVGRGGAWDRDEAMPLATAFWGMVIGFALLVGFSLYAGASVWVAVAYPALFLVLSVVVTRIRAELGHPVHDLHFAGPELVLTQIAGTANIGKRDLTILSVYFWQNRAYRNHPMPHQLEGFKMAEVAGFDKRPFAAAMVWAGIIGAAASFWGWLEPAFRMGVDTKWTGAARHFGQQPYQRLQGWLYTPEGPRWGAMTGMLVGFLSVGALIAGRSRFTGWPFHPIGYAVSGGWSMNCLWLPLLIAWVLKTIILRYGQAKLYRAALPFFIGLVLGEFTVGSIWTIIGIALGIPTYGFWV